jgi:hypothetical protein
MMHQHENSKQSKTTTTKIDEADILKFQLLSAYVGMRTQDIESLEKDLELTEVKKKLAEIAREDAVGEVTKYHNWMSETYGIRPTDSINYADGTIQRNSRTTHENQNQEVKKVPTGRQTEEEKEEETGQTKK